MLKFPGPPRIPSSGMFKFVSIRTYDFLDMAYPYVGGSADGFISGWSEEKYLAQNS